VVGEDVDVGEAGVVEGGGGGAVVEEFEEIGAGGADLEEPMAGEGAEGRGAVLEPGFDLRVGGQAAGEEEEVGGHEVIMDPNGWIGARWGVRT